MSASRAQEHPAHSQVDQGGDAGNGGAGVDGREGLQVEKTPQRIPGNAGCADEDQHSLQAAGKEFNLLVTIGMRGVDRPGCIPERQEGRGGGQKVGSGLGHFRQQADRAGDPVGDPFQDERNQSGQDGQEDRVLQVGLDHRQSRRISAEAMAAWLATLTRRASEGALAGASG